MAVWAEVAGVLTRLRDQEPSPLKRYPDPRGGDDRPPPFTIGLAAWASGTAEELHREFSDDVELTVGALPYPPGSSRAGTAATEAAEELQAATNGQVIGVVVDPGSGAAVGGYSGAQRLAAVKFRAGPGQTVRVPLLIGTDSFDPRLGYTVPAGQWGVQVTLALGPGVSGAPRRRTPSLPLTITS